jgi:two-component system invasion response regulator UvrY
MLKVLIADDHAIVRQGLRRITEKQADTIAGEASNGQEVLVKIREEEWDVLVLDISMPDCNGLDVLREVKQLKKNLPVLVLSMHPEEEYAIRVLKEGASGYMNKDCAPNELWKAIEQVVAGGKYVSQTLAVKLAFDLNGVTVEKPHETLSNREYRVLLMIGTGLSVSEIAGILSLSVKTVSTYRSRVLEKLDLRNNADIIRYVIDHKLS